MTAKDWFLLLGFNILVLLVYGLFGLAIGLVVLLFFGVNHIFDAIDVCLIVGYVVLIFPNFEYIQKHR